MVAKETSSKSQVLAGVGGVHLLDCGYWEAPLTAYPHTASSIFPPLQSSTNITYQTMMR